jgi:cupin fold WbuC family metalloprotein
MDMRIFDRTTVTATIDAARTRPRRRANLNIHPRLDDPIQRMFNVLQPGSYVRPHCHEPERWELFVILRGRAGVLVFGLDAAVAATIVLDPKEVTAVEIPGGSWHTVLALAPDTVLFEVKPGPFRPLEDKDFAPWAPAEGSAAAADLLASWQEATDSRG